MKVLFLDIDGVCNSRKYAKRRYMKTSIGGVIDIDPEAAKLVRHIIMHTGCSVVLSSTWRIWEHSRTLVREDVCDFIDVTVDWPREKRGAEVQEWLDRHPEVTNYAILDDDADFLPGQHLFKTTFEDGLTPEIAQAVIVHLNKNVVDKL